MSIDEFIFALQNVSNLEFNVVLRNPEEIELLQKENDALKLQNQALEARLSNVSGLMSENMGLRSRLKMARKMLNSLGISTEMLDR